MEVRSRPASRSPIVLVLVLVVVLVLDHLTLIRRTKHARPLHNVPPQIEDEDEDDLGD
jgi:hypothetical protein